MLPLSFNFFKSFNLYDQIYLQQQYDHGISTKSCHSLQIISSLSNRELRVDDSKKVHIGLVIALILLNIHFLSSQRMATVSSSGLCFYMALSLHYFLLATFSWMALEGFHLYLHFVKVFNIYIKSYLLKLNIVAWGKWHDLVKDVQ